MPIFMSFSYSTYDGGTVPDIESGGAIVPSKFEYLNDSKTLRRFGMIDVVENPPTSHRGLFWHHLPNSLRASPATFVLGPRTDYVATEL
jgi:hypothetical protein